MLEDVYPSEPFCLVERFFGLDKATLLQKGGNDAVRSARAAVAARLHLLGRSYTEIGRVLERDHSTAQFLVKRSRHAYRLDPRFIAVTESP